MGAEQNSKNEGWKSIAEILQDWANPVKARQHFPELPRPGINYFDTLRSLKNYYQRVERDILMTAKENLRRWYKLYPMDWSSVFTVIEYEMWCCIRYSGIVLYPQYPVLNYFVDFGNPHLKIAVECDGEQYHTDKQKDQRRDKLLNKAGWTVFRISGSKFQQEEEFEWFNYNDEFNAEKFGNYLRNTPGGLIKCIEYVYFTGKIDKQKDELFRSALLSFESKSYFRPEK